MKKTLQATTGTLLAIFLAFFISSSVLASSAMKSLEETNNAAFANNKSKITDVSGGIGTLLGIILSFLGTAFFLIIVYAGFKWMFARDNTSEVQKAKDLITNAVIGLIVVLSAYAITTFLSGQLINK